jgi:hypothetical protein
MHIQIFGKIITPLIGLPILLLAIREDLGSTHLKLGPAFQINWEMTI